MQEDIFEDFVTKLEFKISKVRLGPPDDSMSDITFPQIKKIHLQKIIKDASSLGIKVYQKDFKNPEFQPTLLIGGRVYGNNVINEDKDEVPVATVLGFRSASEAINLANNTRQGFAASIWTENLGLANEVSKRLNVGTVWINSYGKFSPEISFTLFKLSGCGFYGGKEGIYQFLQNQKFHDDIQQNNCTDCSSPKRYVEKFLNKMLYLCIFFYLFYNSDINEFVALMKKAQEDWFKLPRMLRIQHLRNFTDKLENFK